MVKQFRILAYMFQYLLQRLAFAIFGLAALALTVFTIMAATGQLA
jgi:hypothetical protein